MKKLIIALVFLSSCKAPINLSSVGYIAYFNAHSVLITYPCLETKRPDCYATARYSREDFPFPIIGELVQVKPVNNYTSTNEK